MGKTCTWFTRVQSRSFAPKILAALSLSFDLNTVCLSFPPLPSRVPQSNNQHNSNSNNNNNVDRLLKARMLNQAGKERAHSRHTTMCVCLTFPLFSSIFVFVFYFFFFQMRARGASAKSRTVGLGQ